MFQFRRFPSYTYLIQYRIPCGGFPHSEISGSMLICSSPKLIAAYHVLHRLLMPRHSPCALFSLTNKAFALQVHTIKKVHLWFSITVELCRLISLKFIFAKIVFYPIWLNKFPFMLPSHNCIIITMFSFQGAFWISKRLNEVLFTKCFSQSLPALFSWWRVPGSNRWPPACKAGALPAELTPHRGFSEVVGQNGLEPSTSRLSVVCSSQLSYWPILASLLIQVHRFCTL